MRTVRSFDPCLPCGVHMYLGNGKVLETHHSPHVRRSRLTRVTDMNSRDSSAGWRRIEDAGPRARDARRPGCAAAAQELVQAVHGSQRRRPGPDARRWLSGAARPAPAIIGPVRRTTSSSRACCCCTVSIPSTWTTRVREALDKTRPYLQIARRQRRAAGHRRRGVVRLRLQGSCHGCPSSAMTLKMPSSRRSTRRRPTSPRSCGRRTWSPAVNPAQARSLVLGRKSPRPGHGCSGGLRVLTLSASLGASIPARSAAFDVLRRFARPRPPVERCDLCGLALGARARAPARAGARRLVCACDACAMLFSAAGGHRYKRVPARRAPARRLPAHATRSGRPCGFRSTWRSSSSARSASGSWPATRAPPAPPSRCSTSRPGTTSRRELRCSHADARRGGAAGESPRRRAVSAAWQASGILHGADRSVLQAGGLHPHPLAGVHGRRRRSGSEIDPSSPTSIGAPDRQRRPLRA